MAIRPIFIPNFEGEQLVTEISLEFYWFPGMAVSQKQKSIHSLHEAAKHKGYDPLLEISSKSLTHIGKQLSAFYLELDTIDYGKISVESAFQGSKVFQSGGPFKELYRKNGWEIKKDLRLKESGELQAFIFEGIEWELEPKTAFYDWLYLNALNQNTEIAQQLLAYQGFTDIEFNPQKSFNCQARTCALYVSLQKRGELKPCLNNREQFLYLLKKDAIYQPHSKVLRQEVMNFSQPTIL